MVSLLLFGGFLSIGGLFGRKKNVEVSFVNGFMFELSGELLMVLFDAYSFGVTFFRCGVSFFCGESVIVCV